MSRNRRPPARTKRPLRPAAGPAGTRSAAAGAPQDADLDPTDGLETDAPAGDRPSAATGGSGTTPGSPAGTSPGGGPPARPGAAPSAPASGPAPRKQATRSSAPPPRQRAGGGARSRRPPPRRRPKSSGKKWLAAVLAVIVVGGVIAGIVLSSGGSGGSKAAAKGPEGIAVPAGAPLAPVVTTSYGQPVDGISCLTGEQVAYHIHAHLAIFVNGKQVQVPEGVGIAPPLQLTPTPTGTFVSSGGCFYWLHTHAADGVIHVESPTQKTYTLGQFFDLWGQKLSATQVGPATGQVTVFVNGKTYTGSARDIPLDNHSDIQLDVGTPVVPFQAVDWSTSQL